MSKNIDECSRIYEASGAYTARVDDDGRAVCTSCGNLIADHRVTDMVATDSKPSTGHSEPPQEDPTTKLEDSAELIFADYDSKNITVFEAMERVDELIISELNDRVESAARKLLMNPKYVNEQQSFFNNGVQAMQIALTNNQLSKSKRSE